MNRYKGLLFGSVFIITFILAGKHCTVIARPVARFDMDENMDVCKTLLDGSGDFISKAVRLLNGLRFGNY